MISGLTSAGGFTTKPLCLAVLLALALTPIAQAEVTNVAHYRFGESDPGAANGVTATVTTNELGGLLMLQTNAIHTTDVSAEATVRAGSTLGLDFTFGNYGSNPIVSTLTDNFGMELWVKPDDTASTKCLAYNGTTTTSGWGLYQFSGTYRVLFGGRAFIGGSPATAGEWTHLALVRDNGLTTFYANGVPAGTSATAPNAPTGFLCVGYPLNPSYPEYFAGVLDEVRVFGFAPGNFSTNDLLLNRGVVTTTADSGAGSLRQEIANATSGSTINFDPSLSGQTIILTSGQITMDKNLIIDGSTLASQVIIDGNANGRIFEFTPGTTNALESLTLINGLASGSTPDNNGGAIYLRSSLPKSQLTINNSTLAGNEAGFAGGGIYNDLNGILIINNTTFSGNQANFGAGIFNNFNGRVTLNNSTLTQNNSVEYGGGIFNNSGTVTLNNTTVTGNSASSGGGGIQNEGTLNANNSIVTENTAPSDPDIFGSVRGNNNLISTPAMLTPLGNYGGPTLTMPPLPGSPAIDMGGPTSLTTDQRGLPRVAGRAVDIGAVENTVTEAYPVVMTTADDGPGSLRQVLTEVFSGSTITFTNTLAGQTILLTNGQIIVNKNLSIDGSALSSNVIIDGNASSRIFQFTAGTTNVLDSLTVTHGFAANDKGDAIFVNSSANLTLNNTTIANNTRAEFGGGIYNDRGTVNLNNSVISGNRASTVGGGIYNDRGTVNLNNSVIFGNSGGSVGGGIYNAVGSLNVNNSTISRNNFTLDGAGIYNVSGTVDINNSTISGNRADAQGSGIFLNLGTVNLNNSTISGNAVDSDGGGIFIKSGTVNLNNSTISRNVADSGGGIYIASGSVNGTNTIVAGNTSFLSVSNIIGSLNGINNLISGDPMLAPLGNYGGPTQTMPPLPGSPAIDMGGPTSLATDQRGSVREVNGSVDIGAVEGVFNRDFGLFNPTQLSDGTFQFSFINLNGADFSVLATTNVAEPLSNWTFIGPANEMPFGSGQFYFTDPDTTNFTKRFYRIRFP